MVSCTWVDGVALEWLVMRSSAAAVLQLQRAGRVLGVQGGWDADLVACSVADVTMSLRSGRAASAFLVRPKRTSVLIVRSWASSSRMTLSLWGM